MQTFLLLSILLTLEIETLDFRYHKFNSLTNILRTYAKNYPNKTYLYSIGKSVGNRDLLVLAISATKPNEHLILRPEVKYIGNIHGNEASSRELLLHFIDYLLTTNDKQVEQLLKTTRIHILPSMNPDGFENSIEGDCYSTLGRYNLNKVDLNRNFPDFFKNKSSIIQPETKAIINWLEMNTFLLSASFHSGSLVVNYPFDNYPTRYSFDSYSSTQEDELYRYLAKIYSYNHKTMFKSGCLFDDFEDGITNGAKWYPISGGMQDYNYLKHAVLELTIEISCCKYPRTSNLEKIWLENRNALVRLALEANKGIKGIIKFSNNECAVNLCIIINNIEPAVKTNNNGEYYRILLRGNYTLNVLLNCEIIYSENFELTETNPLVILNVTLSQDLYMKYVTFKDSLKNNSLFCQSLLTSKAHNWSISILSFLLAFLFVAD